MAKYHVNEAGNAAVCKAVKKCPFAAEENHYATAEAARASYEMAMVEELQAELTSGWQKRVHAEAEKQVSTWAEKVAEVQAEEEERLAKQAEQLARIEAMKNERGRTYLSPEAYASINVQGVCCSNCGQNFTPAQAAALLDQMKFISCVSCQDRGDLFTADVHVGSSKDTYAAFDASQVSAMSWYHSTTAADWEEKLTADEGFYAHVGSLQASFDRQIGEAGESSSINAASTFYLYEVEVAQDSRIAKEVSPDENENYGEEYTPGSRPLQAQNSQGAEEAVDVIRYVNKWEDMASVSLVANTKKLRVKSRREVTYGEAWKSPSLYNIAPSETLKIS